MNKKPAWVGINPSPRVFELLDAEQTTVLALLAWSCASNRPVTAADLSALPGRDGKPLGIVEAKQIVRSLSDLKIASVLGMNNNLPLGIRVGGYRPPFAQRPTPAGRPSGQFQTPHGAATAARKPVYEGPKAKTGQVIERRSGDLGSELKTRQGTPAFVAAEAGRLRAAQLKVESASGSGADLVTLAEERKRILEGRIALYRRWQEAEPDHPHLARYLERKIKALPELEFQLERARVKQAELNAGAAGATK